MPASNTAFRGARFPLEQIPLDSFIFATGLKDYENEETCNDRPLCRYGSAVGQRLFLLQGP